MLMFEKLIKKKVETLKILKYRDFSGLWEELCENKEKGENRGLNVIPAFSSC